MTSAKDRNVKAGAANGTESRPSGTIPLNPLGWIRGPVGIAVAAEDAPPQKLLEFAHMALDQQYFAVAIPACKRVLARDPKNVEALTHVSLILYGANHVDQALARIDQALHIDPKYAHAHWDRARILYETKKDLAGAAKSLETFLTLVPLGRDTDRATALLAEIRRSGATPEPQTGPQPGRSTPRPNGG